MEAAQVSHKASDIDLLFQDARIYCRQHDRDSVQHSLWHSDVETKLVATETSLQAAQARNARLRTRLSQLQRVLDNTRAQYASGLESQFCSGNVTKYKRNNLAHTGRAHQQHRDEGALTNGVPTSSSSWSWQDFEARIPKARKRSVRSTLLEKMRHSGIEMTEAELDSGVETQRNLKAIVESGLEKGTDSEIRMMRMLRSCCAEGMADPTADTTLGMALLVALGNGSPSYSSKNHNAQESNERRRISHEDSGNKFKIKDLFQIETDGPWRYQACLRSHLDAVRSVLVVDDVLLSCGEDTTVKAWDVGFLKRDSSNVVPEDIEAMEPYATYRGHVSAALCLACTQCSAQDQLFYSGGQDATICAWQLLSPNTYDAYDPSPPGRSPIVCTQRFTGHTDAVWSLALHPNSSVLASAAADGTVRLWDAEAKAERPNMMRVLESPLQDENGNTENDQPTGVAWVVHKTALLLAGFASSRRAVFDMQQNAVVLECRGIGAQSVTSIASFPSHDLAISGHSDKVARLFSLSTGELVHEFSGHGDVVTSVATDPAGGYEVVTGCHDGYIRIFDLRNGKCLQQSRLHMPKFEEAIHCVHHSGQHLVTAGADANIMVLGSSSI